MCATSQMTKGCFVTRFCSRPLLPAAIGEPQEVRTLKRTSFHKKFVEVYLINNKLHTFKTHNLINFDMCRKNFTIKIINISLPPPPPQFPHDLYNLCKRRHTYSGNHFAFHSSRLISLHFLGFHVNGII